jgi:16S rRNA (guanine527-N7)-methyltransferase
MSTNHLTPDQRARLARFAMLVRESPHNLVSRRAREELETRHIPEAVALADLLPSGAHRCLDVGSGGGFPGMVLAIVRPDLEVHLLDATRKKASFLRETAARLELPVTVHHGRAEELAAGELGEGFDLVTARAVAALGALLEITLPFLGPQGVLYAVKGERWAEELADAQDQLRRLGATVLATPEDQEWPETTGDARPRVLVIGRAR